MPTFERSFALNNGEATAVIGYDFGYPGNTAELIDVTFKKISIFALLNPEDFDWVNDRVSQWACEHAEDMKADAAESARDARRDEALEKELFGA